MKNLDISSFILALPVFFLVDDYKDFRVKEESTVDSFVKCSPRRYISTVFFLESFGCRDCNANRWLACTVM